MPIVVAVLGIIIVAMSVAFFTISPAEEAPVATTEVEANRTETMEVEAEAEIAVNPTTPEPVTDTVDAAATVAARTIVGESSYTTPARLTHTIEVSLTLNGEMVTDVAVDYNNGAGPANDHQKRFDSAYRTQVVGKTLSEISLSRVGGASLTSAGFNKAVEAALAQPS